MADFATRFHLSKPEKSFEILPWDSDDAQIYFGDKALNLELRDRIEAGYTLGKPPKIYLQGRWGAGKTHHLYHFKYVLENQGLGDVKNVAAPYLQIECESDTPYQYLHRKMMNALGLTTVKEAITEFLMNQGPGRVEAQKKLFGSSNLIIATQVLSIGDEQLAWRWMCGDPLSGAELKSLNVTSDLVDTTELVDVLVRVGRLLRLQNKRILFLVDEVEGLKNVSKPNAQRSWHDGIRNLAGNENDSVGFILAIHVDNNEPSPGFITEDDIKRRITQKNFVTLDPYSEASQIIPFLQDLFAARIRRTELTALPADVTIESFPFTVDALDLFTNELLTGAVPATPSKIIEGVSECAWEAHRKDVQYITHAIVQDVMPRVTAAA